MHIYIYTVAYTYNSRFLRYTEGGKGRDKSEEAQAFSGERERVVGY